jgi:divalent metal cation (Fe/Co/Zn/Cd) transporter
MKALKKIGAVVAGFLVASAIMLIFLSINHWIFPFYSPTPPWTAYILVCAGWAVGAFAGGYIATWLTGENRFRSSAALAALFVVAGVFYMSMFEFPVAPMILAIIILAIAPYLGHRMLLTFEANKRKQMGHM